MLKGWHLFANCCQKLAARQVRLVQFDDDPASHAGKSWAELRDSVLERAATQRSDSASDGARPSVPSRQN